MKLKLSKAKKYLYLINDISSLLLKKEEMHAQDDVKRIRRILIIIAILFIASILLNIYFYL